MTARLVCKSVNHRGDEDEIAPLAVVTRCVRCRKPTCSSCEGVDDGLRDVCDGCAEFVHSTIRKFRAQGRFRQARAIVRKWAARGRFREVLADHNLDTPETR